MPTQVYTKDAEQVIITTLDDDEWKLICELRKIPFGNIMIKKADNKIKRMEVTQSLLMA